MGKRTFRSKSAQTSPRLHLTNGHSCHSSSITSSTPNYPIKLTQKIEQRQVPDKGRLLHGIFNSVTDTLTTYCKGINMFTKRDTTETITRRIDDEVHYSDESENGFFPRYFHWILFILTLTFRTWYVSKPSNWWVLHPDEIYQTMEVAHSELYGYGFRPYEYLPPPDVSPINVTSQLRNDEIDRGMYSMRSFLLPKLLSLVMYIGHVISPSMSPYLVTKLFHVAVTSLLPVAIYKFALVLHGSRDIATLAAIFVCSSTALNVFGTHTLSNSFISPVLFYSLVPLIKTITLTKEGEIHSKDHTKRSNQMDDHSPNDDNHVYTNENHYSNGHLMMGQANGRADGVTDIGSTVDLHDTSDIQTKTPTFNGHVNERPTINDYINEKSTFNGDVNGKLTINGDINGKSAINGDINRKSTVNGSINGKPTMNGDINGNVIHEGHVTENERHKNGLGTSHVEGNLMLNGYSQHHKNGFRKTGPSTDGIVISKHKRVPDVVVKTNLCQNLWDYILGLCLALCVYIRADSILIPIVCLFAGLHPRCVHNLPGILRGLRYYILGGLTGLVLGGLDDRVMYGNWFLSPVQWFRFNVWHKWSGEIFGTSTTSFYLDKLVDLEPFMLIVIFLFVISVILTVISTSQSTSSFPEFRNQNRSLLMFIALLVSYSLSGHKELRFFHNTIVLMYVAFAEACMRIIRDMLILMKNQNNNFTSHLLYLFLSCIVSSHIYHTLHLKDSGLSQWVYGKSVNSNEVNVCLDFLRQQNDVTGVYVDHDFYMFGGYSILHKNVSIMAKNRFDILEYSIKDRVFVNDKFVLRSSRPKSLSLFWKISEFISIHNSPYLLKHLIRQREYNYIVLPSDRQFVDFGYKTVFSFGETNVLKRVFKEKYETKLRKLAESIPIGSNATVMEYEGFHLNRFGLETKAERRLLISNRLESSRLGPFQLLRNLFWSRKETDNLNKVMKACLQVHTRNLCHSGYVPIDIYKESN